jgi:type IV secretory pathway TrbD component
MTRTGDLLTSQACRAAAAAAAAACIVLAAAQQWLAAGLVLWLVPSLLFVGGLAHRAHNRRKAGRA